MANNNNNNNGVVIVKFEGSVIEATVTNKASVVEQWFSEIRRIHNDGKLIMGLYCEWMPNIRSSLSNNKIATLQLFIARKCIIIQMLHLDHIPPSIKNLVALPNVAYLIGYNIDTDVRKLDDEFGLKCIVKTYDVLEPMIERWPELILGSDGCVTLSHIALGAIGLRMKEALHVELSNWEARVLSIEQIEFACINAFACYEIGYYTFVKPLHQQLRMIVPRNGLVRYYGFRL